MAGQSSAMICWSLTDVSVLGSQVFGQALMDSCEHTLERMAKYILVHCITFKKLQKSGIDWLTDWHKKAKKCKCQDKDSAFKSLWERRPQLMMDQYWPYFSFMDGEPPLECRVRFLFFLGIGQNVQQAAFIMHTAQARRSRIWKKEKQIEEKRDWIRSRRWKKNGNWK